MPVKYGQGTKAKAIRLVRVLHDLPQPGIGRAQRRQLTSRANFSPSRV